MKPCPGSAVRSVCVFLAMIVGLCLNVGAARGDDGSTEPYRMQRSTAGKSACQFLAGGHMMFFFPDKVSIALVEQTALDMEFVGGGVEPMVSGPGGVLSWDPNTLVRVEYKNLWPGVTLRYEKAKKGIVESTFIVGPGVDLAWVRLRYNLPISLEFDGSLVFSSPEGTLKKSAPAAWQDIRGERIPVPIDFWVSGNQVGFVADTYDTRYPLVIDPVYSWHPFRTSGRH